MAEVINLLERPVYGMNQVDRLLGLKGGTARRWIDGYVRSGTTYSPVIREQRTGEELVTWGEFVETRLLSEFRDAGAQMIHMRPAIEALRDELNTRYPLASARTWLQVEGRELVRQVEEQVGLERRLRLVVVRDNQELLWSKPAHEFSESVEWTDAAEPLPRLLRPARDIDDVVVDPLRGFGEPVVRNVRTEVIAELVRAGDSPAMIAELYELPQSQVDAAIRYELTRTVAA